MRTRGVANSSILKMSEGSPKKQAVDNNCMPVAKLRDLPLINNSPYHSESYWTLHRLYNG